MNFAPALVELRCFVNKYYHSIFVLQLLRRRLRKQRLLRAGKYLPLAVQHAWTRKNGEDGWLNSKFESFFRDLIRTREEGGEKKRVELS